MPPPRYKSNLERPLSTGSIKVETVKPDYRATATSVAIGGAVLWVPTQVPTPARMLGGAVVGRRAAMALGKC